MRGLLLTIREHNAAWEAWFDQQGLRPHRITYEQLVVGDPHRCVEGIAALLRIALPAHWRADPPREKQADHLNDRWARALREHLAFRGEEYPAS